MKNKNFLHYLGEIVACRDAIEWVKKNPELDSDGLWRSCERGDWMGWFLVKAQKKLGITRKQIVPALCDCAEISLKYFEKKYPDDKRPRKAIQVARKWSKELATDNDLRSAAYAAADASADAYAAADASAAAYAAYAAAYAAAAYAAYADAYAAAAAYAAAYAAADARSKTLKKCADIFRKHFPTLDL